MIKSITCRECGTVKKLFIYYSHTGNGEAVAAYLAQNGYDLRRVTPKKELPRPFFCKMMQGGFLAGIGYRAPLVDFDADVTDYDAVTVGMPIWNGRPACPVNTVLRQLEPAGKQLSFILYAGGGAAPKTVKRLHRLYPNAPITVLKEPKKYPDELQKIPL